MAGTTESTAKTLNKRNKTEFDRSRKTRLWKNFLKSDSCKIFNPG